jgi:hypothetical protein
MKLLTTIAAVLISISALSQDLIEYDKGTFLSEGVFTQNGEELSMQQIDDLSALHKAGRGNVRKGNRFDRMYKDGDLRILNNGLNFLGGAATGFVGGFSVLLGSVSYATNGPVYTQGVTYIIGTAGAGLCVVSYKAFSRITSSSEGCRRKRDRQFKKVAEKINQAIKAANQ